MEQPKAINNAMLVGAPFLPDVAETVTQLYSFSDVRVQSAELVTFTSTEPPPLPKAFSLGLMEMTSSVGSVPGSGVSCAGFSQLAKARTAAANNKNFFILLKMCLVIKFSAASARLILGHGSLNHIRAK